jgi:hypothetical protein
MIGLAIALFLAPVAIAQSSNGESVSDTELENFAAALQDVQEIRQGMAEETQQAVGESPLEQQRFEEIYGARQSGGQQDAGTTEAENRQFEELMSQIQEIQQQSNEEMVQAVEEEGLSVQRFNEIAQAIQQNPELQQEFREMQPGSSS